MCEGPCLVAPPRRPGLAGLVGAHRKLTGSESAAHQNIGHACSPVKKLAVQFLHTSESRSSRDRQSPCLITPKSGVEPGDAIGAIDREVANEPALPLVRRKLSS